MKKQVVFFGFNFLLRLALGVELPTQNAGQSAEHSNVKSYASPLSAAIELVYAPTSFKHYQWSGGGTNDARFSGFRVNAEWIAFGDSPYGKPVLGIGVGAAWISDLAVDSSKFGTLFVIPVEPYIGYRMDYFRNQVVVPYGRLGLGLAYLQEEVQVADGKRLSHDSYLGLDLAVGAEVWLNFVDRKSARNLDASTGINNVYLLVEYFKSRELGAKWANLAREEVRLGMRFEF